MSSILPPHLGELERDIEGAMSRLEDIDIPTSTLYNPWTCPVAVLPYLAWALSVDHWDSRWSESVKRQVVATSLDVHRIKGTRPAIELALSAVDIDTQITEWFEHTPRHAPGTFTVDALVRESGIDDDTVTMLTRQIDAANRRSAHYLLRLILSANGQAHVGAATLSAPSVTVEPYTLRQLNSLGHVHVAMAASSSFSVTVECV